MRPALRTFLIAATLFGGALAAPGCADNVPTETNACPCSTGYICCESGVCAREVATCGAATAALSIGAQGRWTGYVENAGQKLLADDSLDITFDVDANGALEGRVVFGAGPPAPPTDPMTVWPEPGTGKGGFLVNGSDYFTPLGEVQPVVGFPLGARDIRWEARRLRFTLEPVEAWATWCDLQSPHPAAMGDYICAPEYTNGRIDDGGIGRCYPNGSPDAQAVDCQWSQACSSRICDCTASSCSVRTASSPNSVWPIFRFDIALRGDEGDGSLYATNTGTSYNVRLIRAAR
jgi:hypothetical protein